MQHITVTAQATVLALGGASWQRLGSDGAWVPWLRAKGIDIADLQPANCGFNVTAHGKSHTRPWQQPVMKQPSRPSA